MIAEVSAIRSVGDDCHDAVTEKCLVELARKLDRAQETRRAHFGGGSKSKVRPRHRRHRGGI